MSETDDRGLSDRPHETAGDPEKFSGDDGLRLGGVDYSIRPGQPCPDTVLVTGLGSGGYLLVGYPEGEPAAFIVAKDAGLLRRALGNAFAEPQDAAVIREDRELLAELNQLGQAGGRDTGPGRKQTARSPRPRRRQ